jgi:hydroxyethylthiazole kinase-like uncharacterized protein yjeF
MRDALNLYSVKDLRAIETAAQAQLPPHTLMQRAGRAAAQWAQELLNSEDARVLAVAGPGNNGGDALEAALCLCQAGIDAQVLLLADDAQLTGDAALAWQRASHQGIPIHAANAADALFAQDWDLVLDGLFGIGLTRAIAGPAGAAVLAMNALPCPVLALDLPSGLDADTGRVVGADGGAVRATHTLTFIANKPGLHTGAARDLVGTLRIADLELDAALFPATQARVASVAGFAAGLKPRRHDSHKGSYGDVIMLGGARGMTGAPVLGARAALHCGAGRVHIGFIDPGLAADAGQPELMCRPAEDLDFNSGITVAGPGMGQQRHAADQLARALSSSAPLVLDADALNLVAAESALRIRLQTRRAPTLITPHPLEAARLLGCTVAVVQNDRLAAARRLAAELQAVVILKGSGSVLARPDGQVVINTTGNPAMATAGSGDVLAGVCGALLAQGWPAWEAAQGATWMHGAAADHLVEQGVGPIGLVASELIPALRLVLNALVRDCAS